MQEASQILAGQARGGQIPWIWVVLTVIGLEVALILSAVAWVAIYSYLIHPGEQPAFYQDYAQSASPIVSIVMGIPFWFFACRWVGRKAGPRAVGMCLWVWFIFFLIDVMLHLLVGAKASGWTMMAISDATKMFAAYFGGKAALRRLSV